MDVRDIDIGMISANMDFNHRVKYEHIEELARDIKRQGQMTPIILEDLGDGSFALIAGFRRYLAHTQIGAETITADVRPEMTPEQRRWINLLENVNRSNLTTYEVALSCLELRDVHGLSANQIVTRMGAAKGYSKSNINNLISALKALHPKILQAWKDDHPAISAVKIFKWKSMTHEEQLDQWAVACGDVPQSLGGKEGSETPEPDKEDRPKRRATGAQLIAALAMVKKSGSEHAKAVAGALKYALAQADTIKVGRETVYDPKASGEASE